MRWVRITFIIALVMLITWDQAVQAHFPIVAVETKCLENQRWHAQWIVRADDVRELLYRITHSDGATVVTHGDVPDREPIYAYSTDLMHDSITVTFRVLWSNGVRSSMTATAQRPGTCIPETTTTASATTTTLQPTTTQLEQTTTTITSTIVVPDATTTTAPETTIADPGTTTQPPAVTLPATGPDELTGGFAIAAVGMLAVGTALLFAVRRR
jgi:LPXTG-motif cell wall-anchored protein